MVLHKYEGRKICSDGDESFFTKRHALNYNLSPVPEHCNPLVNEPTHNSLPCCLSKPISKCHSSLYDRNQNNFNPV